MVNFDGLTECPICEKKLVIKEESYLRKLQCLNKCFVYGVYESDIDETLYIFDIFRHHSFFSTKLHTFDKADHEKEIWKIIEDSKKDYRYLAEILEMR